MNPMTPIYIYLLRHTSTYSFSFSQVHTCTHTGGYLCLFVRTYEFENTLIISIAVSLNLISVRSICYGTFTRKMEINKIIFCNEQINNIKIDEVNISERYRKRKARYINMCWRCVCHRKVLNIVLQYISVRLSSLCAKHSILMSKSLSATGKKLSCLKWVLLSYEIF